MGFSDLTLVQVGSLRSQCTDFICLHLLKMIIYKDIFTGDEMFSDSYPIKVVDGVMYEFTGKYISVKHGDIQLDGANPSAEDAAEESDVAVESATLSWPTDWLKASLSVTRNPTLNT